MTNPVYNIFVAINQPLTEAGIVTLLADHSFYRVTAGGHGREEIFRGVQEKRSDLLIVDYVHREVFSLEDLQRLLQEVPDLNVLVISSDDNRESILRSIQIGIKGYITDQCGRSEFLLAVHSTSRGDKFFCSKILDVILDDRLSDQPEEGPTTLTAREKEMLKYLAMGYSTQQIADTVHLSPHTVQTHRKSVIRKLKIKSPTEFVIHALDLGLMPQKQ